MKVKLTDLKAKVEAGVEKLGYEGGDAKAIVDTLLYAETRGNNQGITKIATGGVLVLVEIDDDTKQPTGRTLERKVGFVGKTKDFDFWSKEEVEKYGYQIISLLGVDE